jgi:hypothetical protein
MLRALIGDAFDEVADVVEGDEEDPEDLIEDARHSKRIDAKEKGKSKRKKTESKGKGNPKRKSLSASQTTPTTAKTTKKRTKKQDLSSRDLASREVIPISKRAKKFEEGSREVNESLQSPLPRSISSGDDETPGQNYRINAI